MINDAIFVIFFAIAMAAMNESISWYFVFRKPAFLSLQKRILANQKLFEKQNSEIVDQKRKKQHIRDLNKIKSDLVQDNQSFLFLRIPSLLAPLLAMFLSFNVLGSMYSNKVVGYLPFEPISLLRKLTQRGLLSPIDNYVCSYTVIYTLASLVLRSLVPRIMGWDIKISATPQSLDIAENEEDNKND